MDWKLERQTREKNQILAIKESARNINIMDEMEREFIHIFGEGRNAGYALSRGQAGDPVTMDETSRRDKEAKGN